MLLAGECDIVMLSPDHRGLTAASVSFLPAHVYVFSEVDLYKELLVIRMFGKEGLSCLMIPRQSVFSLLLFLLTTSCFPVE